MTSSAQKIRSLVSYLEEKESMGVLWCLAASVIDVGMWRLGNYQKIRVSFNAPPLTYARILLVELKAQMMYFACTQLWRVYTVKKVKDG